MVRGTSTEMGSDIRVWYRIGKIDPRHNITETEVREIAREAELMWERAIGQNLIHYKGSSAFEINILWGELSEYQERRSQAYALLHGMRLRVDAAERKLKEVDDLTKQVEASYLRDREAYLRNLKVHNEEVVTWNRKGGAPPDVYRRLGQRSEELRADSEALEIRREAFNRQVGVVEALGAEYDARIDEHNRSLDSFKKQFPGEQTMDQGMYRGNGIDVYYFEDADDLRITIAHEMGHALGIGHTDDPGTLMYPIKSDKNGHLKIVTEVDLRYLREALANPPDFARIWWEHHGAGRRFQRTLPGLLDLDKRVPIPWAAGHEPVDGHSNCCGDH